MISFNWFKCHISTGNNYFSFFPEIKQRSSNSHPTTLPKMPLLTERNKELIRETWPIVKERGDNNITEIGRAIFIRSVTGHGLGKVQCRGGSKGVLCDRGGGCAIKCHFSIHRIIATFKFL